MRMQPQCMSIAVAGLIVALTGCGSSTTPQGVSAAGTASQTPTSSSSTAQPTPTSEAASTASEPKPVVITIKDFTYSVPAPVAPGAKVTVKNDDAEKHTITSAPKGAFEVTADGRGGEATFTAPTKPGSYKFTCTFHADMNGTLVVR